MQDSIKNINFGDMRFDFTDVWSTKTETPIKEILIGPDEGCTYLSFPLTDEQKAFLGNTNCTHIRLAVKAKN